MITLIRRGSYGLASIDRIDVPTLLLRFPTQTRYVQAGPTGSDFSLPSQFQNKSFPNRENLPIYFESCAIVNNYQACHRCNLDFKEQNMEELRDPRSFCSSDRRSPKAAPYLFSDDVCTRRPANHSLLGPFTPIRHPGHRRTTSRHRRNSTY